MTASGISLLVSDDDRRVAAYAVAAITLTVAEAAIPSPLPGIKPGLANIIVLIVRHSGHVEVEQQEVQVREALTRDLQRLRAGVGMQDLEPQRREQLFDARTDVQVVVGQQDSARLEHGGRVGAVPEAGDSWQTACLRSERRAEVPYGTPQKARDC